MGKLFIIEQHEDAQTDAIAKGLEVAELLGKQPQVFAYCYEYFSGDEYYSQRLAGAAQQRLMKEKQAEVSAHLKALNAEDVPLHIIWSKYLYEHVSNHAARYGFDMVVKTVHKSEHFLPTDWHLIRSTKVPLMLLSDNPIKKASCILMAVDLDAKSEQKQRLNRLVLQHGRELAEATGAKLHLAHIIRVPKVIRDLEVLNLHEMVKSAWRRHQTMLELTGLPKEQIHIIAGDPDLCLYQLSCRLKSDYLVIGARQRQGLMGRIIGNTAEQILRQIRSNVLVIPSDEVQGN